MTSWEQDEIDLAGCCYARLSDWAYEEMADAEFCHDWRRYNTASALFVYLNERRAA